MGVAGLAASAYKSATKKKTARQELQQSLRDALYEKQAEKYRELTRQVEKTPLDDPYWDQHPNELKFLLRMMHQEENLDDQDVRTTQEIDATLRALEEDHRRRRVEHFKAAKGRWDALTREEQEACRSPCSRVSPEDRRVLIQTWPARHHPPAWRGKDAPGWMGRARAYAGEASESVVNQAKAAVQFAADSWRRLDAEGFFVKIRDAAARVSRALEAPSASAARYRRLASLAFPVEPTSQGAVVELLDLLQQKDRYVYSLSTLAMTEAIETHQDIAAQKWGIALPRWLVSAPSRRGTLVMECLDRATQDHAIPACMETHLTQSQSRYLGLGTQVVPILSRDGQFKAPNFTSELGWMFDMQSNTSTQRQDNVPVPRIDDNWMDAVGEALRSISRAPAADLHGRLRAVRRSMEAERMYSYTEMTQAAPRGVPRVDGGDGSGDDGTAAVFRNTRRYAREITEQYRQSHSRRSQWLQRMIALIDVILPRLGQSFDTASAARAYTERYLARDA